MKGINRYKAFFGSSKELERALDFFRLYHLSGLLPVLTVQPTFLAVGFAVKRHSMLWRIVHIPGVNFVRSEETLEKFERVAR